jgi:hypothetical protein
VQARSLQQYPSLVSSFFPPSYRAMLDGQTFGLRLGSTVVEWVSRSGLF